MLDRVDIGLLPDGTAIGTALALALGQLKELPAKASAIVLITDGANNTGKPTPYVAAEAARALGVRIHTIGVSAPDSTALDDGFIWREGRTPDRLTSSDEAVLRRIADRSGGRYFRATDPEALERIMTEIDPLERTDVRISETRDYRELFPWVLIPARASARGLSWCSGRRGCARCREKAMSFAHPSLLVLARGRSYPSPCGSRCAPSGGGGPPWSAFGDPRCWPGPPRSRDGAPRWALRVGGLALALLALARPQLGERTAGLARTGRDVLVLLDLSRSMNATDLGGTRLATAKRLVWETIAASPGDRVGLVVFGGSAFLQLPLTSDHGALQAVPRRGEQRRPGGPGDRPVGGAANCRPHLRSRGRAGSTGGPGGQ